MPPCWVCSNISNCLLFRKIRYHSVTMPPQTGVPGSECPPIRVSITSTERA